jgi:hypothetical protein
LHNRERGRHRPDRATALTRPRLPVVQRPSSRFRQRETSRRLRTLFLSRDLCVAPKSAPEGAALMQVLVHSTHLRAFSGKLHTRHLFRLHNCVQRLCSNCTMACHRLLKSDNLGVCRG